MADPNVIGTIVILGETGTGKSQLANTISGTTRFPVSHGTDSCTLDCLDTTFYSDAADGNVRLFDTPGLNDSAGRDSSLVRQMHTKLHTVDNVVAFVFTLNYHQPRLMGSTRATLLHFHDVFGDVFADRLVIVFTHAAATADLSERKRVQREERRREVNRGVAELVGMPDSRVIPTFFVDTDEDDGDAEAVADTLDRLLAYAVTLEPASLTRMIAVESPADKIKAEAEAAKVAEKDAKAAEEAAKAEAAAARRAAEAAQRSAAALAASRTPAGDTVGTGAVGTSPRRRRPSVRHRHPRPRRRGGHRGARAGPRPRPTSLRGAGRDGRPTRPGHPPVAFALPTRITSPVTGTSRPRAGGEAARLHDKPAC